MWKLTEKRKVNSTTTISSICAGSKSCLFVPLCRMIPTLIVRSAFEGNITKLEADFFNGYRDDIRVFYISAIDSKGDFQFIDDKVVHLGAQIRLKSMPYLTLNWIQTLYLHHIRIKCSLYEMIITIFALEKITLTTYIPKIMSIMSLWILSIQHPNLTTFQAC